MFACLGLRSILMLCEQTKRGEDGVLTEYLLNLVCRIPAIQIPAHEKLNFKCQNMGTDDIKPLF
ncbi:hypothetical protein SAMN02746065_10626 [Desulfocicer vacuolatum DSM 3385]|uniref:Uncharacterized protein n=1 Tax=Desulfocicer vacuolatum DSM 3385 TaxID=1121400 RepID=A0A1W2AQL5_9BACT|nr:hypothetical protein SAMN02746065_10626 [Desulfocicer vacuolatum DSM 3385]